MTRKLTKEEIRQIKIISRDEAHFKQMLEYIPVDLPGMWRNYNLEKPIKDDLKKHGINVYDIEEIKHPTFDQKLYKESIPILIKWLKKCNSYDVKSWIIGILIEKSISKKYAFDTILSIYAMYDPLDIKKTEGKTLLPIALGNAVIRWADDEHADIIFKLLEKRELKEDNFLLWCIKNFKKEENISKAKKILLKELENQEKPNSRLWTALNVLRKLKAIDTRAIVYPFTEFPKYYKRKTKFDPEIYGYMTDGEVRNEAKKAINSFDKKLSKKKSLLTKSIK